MYSILWYRKSARIALCMILGFITLSLQGLTLLESSPWIGDGREELKEAAWYGEDPVPEFKAEFVLPKGATETELCFACAGFAIVRIGDNKPLPGFTGLEPLWSVFDKTVYYRKMKLGVAEGIRPYPAINKRQLQNLF